MKNRTRTNILFTLSIAVFLLICTDLSAQPVHPRCAGEVSSVIKWAEHINSLLPTVPSETASYLETESRRVLNLAENGIDNISAMGNLHSQKLFFIWRVKQTIESIKKLTNTEFIYGENFNSMNLVYIITFMNTSLTMLASDIQQAYDVDVDRNANLVSPNIVNAPTGMASAISGWQICMVVELTKK